MQSRAWSPESTRPSERGYTLTCSRMSAGILKIVSISVTIHGPVSCAAMNCMNVRTALVGWLPNQRNYSVCSVN